MMARMRWHDGQWHDVLVPEVAGGISYGTMNMYGNVHSSSSCNKRSSTPKQENPIGAR